MSLSRDPEEISPAGVDRLGPLTAVFALAFIHDPMMRWSVVGTRDPSDLLTRCFSYFLEIAIDLGLVWETAAGAGAAVWIPPGGCDASEVHPWNQPRILELCDDGGERYESFWNWVDEHQPDESVWLLDSIAVDPSFQGRGYGKVLVEAGQSRAAVAGCGIVLSTGTERNIPIYTNCGFRIVDHADAPDGGPHVWFMRCDP